MQERYMSINDKNTYMCVCGGGVPLYNHCGASLISNLQLKSHATTKGCAIPKVLF